MGLPGVRNKNAGYIAKFRINDKSLFSFYVSMSHAMLRTQEDTDVSLI